IDVLSEIPAEWARAVSRWERASRRHKTRVQGRFAPDAHTEYVLYQTLVGMWPMDGAARSPDVLASLRERVSAFAIKAAREAKARTSWTDPDEAFEHALGDFISSLFANNDLVRDIESFAHAIAGSGACNSIARMLVQLTAPGVPDTYQGDELWKLALVDPDNRRPVDYALRESALDAILTMSPLGDITSNSFKLFILRAALQHRAKHQSLFATGSYEPLTIRGAQTRHLFAFLRRGPSAASITVVPRLTHTLSRHAPPVGEIWHNTTLHLPATFQPRAPTRWRNALTGAEYSTDTRHTLALPDVLATLPVALLASVETPN
ncbi:MAG: malto-oligosyltrehalose synthase, partial [Gemmatimonadaceae bacterium]